MGKERRIHRRIRAAGISVHLQTGHGQVTCPVEDLSRGGIFIRTGEEFPMGARLEFTLVRPGLHSKLPLGGVVVNARRPAEVGPGNAGVGVRFEGLPQGVEQRLIFLIGEMGLDLTAQSYTDHPPAASGPLPFDVPPPSADEGPRGLGDLFSDLGDLSVPGTDASALADLAEPGAEQTRFMPEPSPPAGAVDSEAPTPAMGTPARGGGELEASRLMMQIRGLLLELGNAQDRIAQQEKELRELREKVARLEEQRRGR